MTLSITKEHGILNMRQEPAVAHIAFANERGFARFVEDNRKAIRSVYERWTMDFEIVASITAR